QRKCDAKSSLQITAVELYVPEPASRIEKEHEYDEGGYDRQANQFEIAIGGMIFQNRWNQRTKKRSRDEPKRTEYEAAHDAQNKIARPQGVGQKNIQLLAPVDEDCRGNPHHGCRYSEKSPHFEIWQESATCLRNRGIALLQKRLHAEDDQRVDRDHLEYEVQVEEARHSPHAVSGPRSMGVAHRRYRGRQRHPPRRCEQVIEGQAGLHRQLRLRVDRGEKRDLLECLRQVDLERIDRQ